MKKNNKGVSLVELLVVIAILAILSTGAFVTINRIGYANTMKAAKSIDSTMSKLRLETMTKEPKTYLYIYNKDDIIYMKASNQEIDTAADLNIATGKKVAQNTVLSYKLVSEEDPIILEDDENICISFKKSSGAFDAFEDDLKYYEYIELKNTSKTASIICIQETGGHWVE